ncbi:hypothetical protein TanjilG_15374 [Lupinus angustifolius]|uniref:Uncharacterized protein n=1 Tax=Lupinus angustifolius TaxID=3871 RepID=A0A394DBZ6_LUPAN|nr:hypothetical protein TanjilG_15374 [Lupinus angustifolius]
MSQLIYRVTNKHVASLFKYYSHEDTEDACKYISRTILDDRPFVLILIGDSRKADNGVVVVVRARGGYGKLVQKELEVQRQLVDYGAGSLGSFPPVIPKSYGRHGGGHGHGGNYRHGRDYHKKRQRDDDRHHTQESSKRTSDHESRRNSDHEFRPEKNPRFRESGDSDEDEEDDRKRRA